MFQILWIERYFLSLQSGLCVQQQILLRLSVCQGNLWITSDHDRITTDRFRSFRSRFRFRSLFRSPFRFPRTFRRLDLYPDTMGSRM